LNLGQAALSAKKGDPFAEDFEEGFIL